MHLNPAEYLIYRIGGVRKTARLLKRAPSTVTTWHQKGRIPSELHVDVMSIAKKLNLDFTTNDLIFGRDLEMQKLK